MYIVHGITDCPACLMAIAELMSRNIEYIFVNADFSPKYRSDIKKEWSWSTFPIIIKVDENDNDELIGGYDDLMHILEKETKAPT